MSLDLSIGRGDNAPGIVIGVPNGQPGDVYRLYITIPGLPLGSGALSTEWDFDSAGNGIVYDPVAKTVTWPATTTQTAQLADTNFYKLRLISPVTQYLISARLYGPNGPVAPSSATIYIPGPVGPPGPQPALSTDIPAPSSTNGAAGTSPLASASDHRHPIDTSREAIANRGAANGYAPLDLGSAVPLANLQVRLAPFLWALQNNLPEGWAGFARYAQGTGALGVDPSSRLWLACNLEPFVMPSGTLATAVSTYAQAPSASGGLGLSASDAATRITALFAAATQVGN